MDAYETAKRENEFLIVLFYRGGWCPICKQWLQDWLKIQDLQTQLKKLNGALLVICAQSQSLVNANLTFWGLAETGIKCQGIGDPTHSIARHFKKEKLINVAISGGPGPYRVHHYTYPKGMAQPACLVIKADGTVLYSWSNVPKRINMMGGLQRPTAADIWRFTVQNLNTRSGAKLRRPRLKSLYFLSAFFKK